jgi:hypothetical protein
MHTAEWSPGPSFSPIQLPSMIAGDDKYTPLPSNPISRNCYKYDFLGSRPLIHPTCVSLHPVHLDHLATCC